MFDEGAIMHPSTFARVLGTSLCAMLLLLTPATAVGSEHKEVDESQLVPALSPAFAPWDCKLRKDGPVCTGAWAFDTGWEELDDIPCEAPLWIRTVQDRHQTRYYDHDYLNYYREARTNDIEYLSASPDAWPTATLRTNVRWTQTFDVRGDDRTMIQTSQGVLWDLRAAQGPALFRVVGTLVEPYDGDATFSGRVTVDGVTTRHVDVLLDDILDEDEFFANFCRAATAGR
jgi:hypothetical protein